MSEKPPADGTNANKQLKPSVSQALWGHLLQRNIPSALRGGPSLSTSATSIAPIDKNGTSMRMLLHDTQATLERFSGHVDKLTSGVENAKREVATAHKVFQFGHEKLVEENVSLLNRCQTEIQKSVGKPAQAGPLEETRKALWAMERTVESLGNRIDALHMLNQTQLQALHTIQEQHSQLLSAIAPVLPLLQSMPLHIAAAQNDLKEWLGENQGVYTQRPRATRQDRRKYSESSPELSSPSFHSSPPPKRRKTDDSSRSASGEYGSSEGPTNLSGSTINMPSSPSPMPGYLVSYMLQQSPQSSPARQKHSRSPHLETSGSARPNLVRQSSPSSPAPPKVLTPATAPFSGYSGAPDPLNASHARDPGLHAGLRTSFSPVLITGSLYSESEETLAVTSRCVYSATSPISPSASATTHVPQPEAPIGPTEANTRLCSFNTRSLPEAVAEMPSSIPTDPTGEPALTVPTCTPTAEHLASLSTAQIIEASYRIKDDTSLPAVHDVSDHTKVSKPMSLKDRRARDLMTDAALRNQEKRFIHLDDDDEDEG